MDIAYRAYSVNIESNISSLSAVTINCIKKINTQWDTADNNKMSSSP